MMVHCANKILQFLNKIQVMTQLMLREGLNWHFALRFKYKHSIRIRNKIFDSFKHTLHKIVYLFEILTFFFFFFFFCVRMLKSTQSDSTLRLTRHFIFGQDKPTRPRPISLEIIDNFDKF